MSEFWKKLCRLLGLNYTWWHWRWLNFKKRMRESFSTDRNSVRHLKSRQKICRCGALAGADDRTCSVCGARLPSAAGQFLGKVFGLIRPGVSPVTAGLVTVMTVDFLLQLVISGGGGFLRPGIVSLLRAGAMESQLVAAGQWWRLLTCVFVHIGIIHFLFNMYALVSVSQFLEREIGSARFFCLFLLTGAGGSLASYALHGEIVMAGASGAIFGLIGFSIAFFRRHGGAAARNIQSFMIRWAIYGFFFGLMVRADNFAHAGGFAAGFLLGAVMEIREDERLRRAFIWKIAAGLLFAALAFSFYSLVNFRLPVD
jgi:rhomboid protease GluP